MAWTAPRTWSNEVVTAAKWNVDVRDNLRALKDPPSANYELNEGSNYTKSTGTGFADIDATLGKLSLQITTTGGDIMASFTGTLAISDGSLVRLAFSLDGVTQSVESGLVSTTPITVNLTQLMTSVAAGSHTINVQWLRSSGTITLYAGAGTASYDVHPQFWVRELT
jgi:hypothetical protein